MFVPKFFLNVSGEDCYPLFESKSFIATEKSIEVEGEDIIAKSSKTYIYLEIGTSDFLEYYRFLDANLDELSTTLKSFQSLVTKKRKDTKFKIK